MCGGLRKLQPTEIFTQQILHGAVRRQDLLRGGAKMEIMSCGTHGGLQGQVQQRLND